MEKVLKKIRVVALMVITLLIVAISFCGVYANNKGIWENALPEYKLGMELNGYRELHFELDSSEEAKNIYVDENKNYKGDVISTENEVPEGYTIESRNVLKNDPEKINIENFEKTKKIIQKRLEKYDLYEYNIRQDSVTGKIVLEVPDDEKVNLNVSLVTTKGELSFIDAQNGIILLDDEKLLNAATYTMTNEEGLYEVYLQLNYNEEGKKILEDITKKYVETVDEAGNDITQRVQVCLDGQAMITTAFKSEITSGTVHVPMGDPTSDYNEFYVLANSVQEIANIVNEEKLPLQYVITDDINIQTMINTNLKIVLAVVAIVVISAVSIYMIVKYKFEGVRQAIFSIGYIALLALMFRYTNVIITINSLIALAIVVVINYIFTFKFLNKLKQESNRKIALKDSLKELYRTITPIAIVAVIFTFMPAVVINSVGMTLFWGLLLQLLFSLITLV